MHTFYASQSIEEANYASGSIMFMRNLDNKKNALIAWDLKAPHVTYRDHEDIDLSYPDTNWKDARTTAKYIWSRNSNLNFLLTIKEVYFQEKSFTINGWYKYETRTYSNICRRKCDDYVRSFANRRAKVNQVDKPSDPKLYYFHTTKNIYSIIMDSTFL